MPYACDPSSLPKYPPNKEIDAKSREESKRSKAGRMHNSSSSSHLHRRPCKALQGRLCSVSMLGRPPRLEESEINRRYGRRKGDDMKSEMSQATNASQVDRLFVNNEKSFLTSKIINDPMKYNDNNITPVA